MTNRRQQAGQVIALDEARRRAELRLQEPREEGLRISGAEYKSRIHRMLGLEPQECTFIYLLRTSLNIDASIQKILPTVNKAARDISLDSNDAGARAEAIEALIAFSEDMEKYYEVRMAGKDKRNLLAEALDDMVVFTHGFDEAFNRRLCEAQKKVLAFDALKENEAENKRQMKKAKIATGTGTAVSVSLAVLTGVAADSLLVFGALVPILSAVYSFYAVKKRNLAARFKEKKEKLELELKGIEEDE